LGNGGALRGESVRADVWMECASGQGLYEVDRPGGGRSVKIHNSCNGGFELRFDGSGSTGIHAWVDKLTPTLSPPRTRASSDILGLKPRCNSSQK